MEKNIKMSILLDIYGKLLTEKQYNLLDDYYNKDFSQTEIAENEEITRQAVRDNLKKGENNLLEYEEKLKIMEKNLIIENYINSALTDIKYIKSKINDKDILNAIKNAEKNLNNAKR